ncbi:MAG: O-antigen ligase family protein [Gemmatimonadota bacterium]
MPTLSGYAQPVAKQLATALLCVAILGIAFGTIYTPWVLAGVVLGVAVLAIAMTAPLALVAIMLVIGPIDLSFVTGGFKSLFPELGGLDMNGIRLLGATAGFLTYILFEPRARAAALGPLGRLWLAFLGFAAATLVVSLDPLEGLRLLLKLLYPFLTFLLVIGLCDSRERLYSLTKYTLIAAAVLALIVNPIFVLNGGYRIDPDGAVRLGGLGLGDSPFAFYCTAILMVVFARFLLRIQPRYLLFSLVLVAWIALTQTRIAALAAVLGIIMIGFLFALSSGNPRALISSLVAATLIGVVLLPNVLERSFGFVPTPGELIQIIQNPIMLYESINWQGRQLLWAILWAAFIASPIFGFGLGSSSAVIRETFPNQNVQVAHNEYMRLATDTGVLGVLLFGAALTVWLVAAVRMARNGDRAVREFAFPAAAGIVAWGVISITDNALDYYTNFTQYIGFLAGGAVVMARTRPVAPTEAG